MKMRSFLPLLTAAMLTAVAAHNAYATPFVSHQNNSGSYFDNHEDGYFEHNGSPSLNSAAYVIANHSGQVISEHNGSQVMPIASLTKLMTALVVLDANLDLDEMLTVSDADVDRIKGTGSRLTIGSRLSRAEMLHIALMSSENRAASALGRHYPGGIAAFVEAMNAKARMLGMWSTHYADSTGLNPDNVSSAQDLAKLAAAAATYPLISQYSTDDQSYVQTNVRELHYRNSNRLVREGEWEFTLSKTGYIREAGRCLVLGTKVNGEPVFMVLLNAHTTDERVADAKQIKMWLENSPRNSLAANQSAMLTRQ